MDSWFIMIKEDNTAIIVKVITKAILICTFLFSVLILYQNFSVFLSVKPFCAHYYFGILIMVIGIIYYILRWNLPDKLRILMISLMSLIPRLLFMLFVQTPITGDFLITYHAATQTIAGDTSWLESPFFSTWAYQIPFVYYQALILKVFGSDLALKILNIAFMVSTNILIYKIAKIFTTPNAAFVCALLYSVYPAPILLTSVLTNQHLSLMLFMLGIYFYISNPSWYRIIVSGVFVFLGNLFRPEGILIIGAVILHMLIKHQDKLKWNNIKNIYGKAILLILVYVFLNQASSLLFQAVGAAPHGISSNCPEWKFVLGLDTDSKGIYNEKSAYILSLKDPKERADEAKKIIQHSLTKCNNLLLFFGDKAKLMWANMESTTWSLLHIQKSRPVWSETGSFTYENALNMIVYMDKAIYI